MAEHLPRILFVDDEPNLLGGLARQLRRYRGRWDMQFESDPVAALARVKDSAFDVVVSDMAMPVLSGLDMVNAMRDVAPDCHYIMLTGTADLKTAMAAINAASIFRFYTKPCPVELLTEGIEAALEAKSPANLTQQLGMAVLDKLALSVLVVDETARLLLANKSGGALLADGDGLFLSAHEICRAESTSQTKTLHDLIAMAASDRFDDVEDTAVMAVSRPSLCRSLSVIVVPLPGIGPEGCMAVGLFISDPERHVVPSAPTIERLFDLTATEARIVHALTQGERLDGAAEQSGVTLSTARTYLKNIFAKTDTGRQSELMKVVLTSLPMGNSELTH